MGYMSFLRGAFFILALFWAGLAAAQTNMQEWDGVAKRVEKALADAKVSTPVLSELRTEIATWRDIFEREKSQNQTTLNTLSAQLAALGDAPSDGSSEIGGIALRRAEITTQIKEIKAPRLIASAAYLRATANIDGIDEIKSNRYWQDLLMRSGSPLNPILWLDTFEYIRGSLSNISSGIAFEARYNDAGSAMGAMMSVVAVLLFFASVIVFIAKRWVNTIARRFGGNDQSHRKMVVRFLTSLFHLGLLYVAFDLCLLALNVLDMHGPRIDAIKATPTSTIILHILVARWIAVSLFSDRGQGLFATIISATQRQKSMRLVQVISWTIVLHHLINAVGQFDRYPPNVLGVLDFIASLIIGACLITLSRLTQYKQSYDAENSGGIALTIYKAVNFLSLIVGSVAIVSSALGYNNVLFTLLYPFVYSLGFASILWVVYSVIQQFFAWMAQGREQSSTTGLIPLLLGLTVIIAALPFFSIFWGASFADLSELWDKFLKGVSIGGIELSPSSFLLLIGVFLAGYFVTQFFKHSLVNSFLPKTNMDIGGQNAIAAGFGYVGILVSILVAVSVAGLNLSSIALVAGALSVGIGFGLQNIVSNFVSGIILLIERPISQGDWIEVGANMGYVKEISVRSTRIETFDRTDVIVPNTDLVSGTVTNYTRGNTIGRLIVPVGVAYVSDTRKVEKILADIVKAHPMVLLNPAPSIVFKGFGADSLDFEMRAILRDVNWMLSVKSELNHQISERFVAEGIEIPFAQRDIWIKNYDNFKLPDNQTE